MKVGEYVRFKTLSREIKIGKVIEIVEPDKESMKKYCVYDLDNNEATVDDYVIKSSSNIIDLIEEHDILKIEEQKGVYTICEVEVFREPYEKYTFLGVRIDNRPIARKLYELNIKSIVTHEQFSQMEYRIGE